jgi:hypothetical protein
MTLQITVAKSRATYRQVLTFGSKLGPPQRRGLALLRRVDPAFFHEAQPAEVLFAETSTSRSASALL